MKLHHVAIIILLLIALLVTWNAVYIQNTLSTYIEQLSALPTPSHVKELYGAVRSVREDYERFEEYWSLTVSHEDLAGVRSAFADLEGAVLSDDTTAFIQAKSRLVDTLRHLGRLSSISIYSIF